jgi:hypothetical protein
MASVRVPGGKRLRLSRKMRAALDLWCTGAVKTQRALAERTKLSEQHISRMFARQDVRVLIRERTRGNLAKALPRAGQRVIELLDGASEHVALDAAELLLGIENIRPAPASSYTTVNLNQFAGAVLKSDDDMAALAKRDDLAGPGYVLDLRRGSRSPIDRFAEPAQTIDAEPAEIEWS